LEKRYIYTIVKLSPGENGQLKILSTGYENGQLITLPTGYENGQLKILSTGYENG
jgi:hypothetical protein